MSLLYIKVSVTQRKVAITILKSEYVILDSIKQLAFTKIEFIQFKIYLVPKTKYTFPEAILFLSGFVSAKDSSDWATSMPPGERCTMVLARQCFLESQVFIDVQVSVPAH